MFNSTLANNSFNPTEPNDADWAEFVAYCGELDALHGQLDNRPEPTPAEWSAHVDRFLARHGLSEAPF